MAFIAQLYLHFIIITELGSSGRRLHLFHFCSHLNSSCHKVINFAYVLSNHVMENNPPPGCWGILRLGTIIILLSNFDEVGTLQNINIIFHPETCSSILDL